MTLHKKICFPLSKCDQICKKLRTSSHLLKKSLMENFIFLCSVMYNCVIQRCFQNSVKHLTWNFLATNIIGLRTLIIFAKRSILDIWQSSEYTSAVFKRLTDQKIWKFEWTDYWQNWLLNLKVDNKYSYFKNTKTNLDDSHKHCVKSVQTENYFWSVFSHIRT